VCNSNCNLSIAFLRSNPLMLHSIYSGVGRAQSTSYCCRYCYCCNGGRTGFSSECGEHPSSPHTALLARTYLSTSSYPCQPPSLEQRYHGTIRLQRKSTLLVHASGPLHMRYRITKSVSYCTAAVRQQTRDQRYLTTRRHICHLRQYGD